MFLALIRIALTLLLASLAATAVLAALPTVLFLLAPAGEDARLGAVILLNVVLVAPALFGLGCLWLPVLLLCRRANYGGREWAVLLAPLSFVGLVFSVPVYRSLIGGPAVWPELANVAALMVFMAPAMMMVAAFFFYFDRFFEQFLPVSAGRAL